MGLFFAVILTAAIVVIGCYLYIKRYEKEVSVVVTSTNEKQAYDLFLNKVGSKIPKDIKVNSIGLEQGWSINVYILTENGIEEAYYRGKDPNFTVVSPLFDKYIKDVKLLSNNFLYSIDNMLPLIDHLYDLDNK